MLKFVKNIAFMKYRLFHVVFLTVISAFAVLSVNAYTDNISDPVEEPLHFNSIEVVFTDGEVFYISMKNLRVEMAEQQIICTNDSKSVAFPHEAVKLIGHLRDRVGVELPDIPEEPVEPDLPTGTEPPFNSGESPLYVSVNAGIATVRGLQPSETLTVCSPDGKLYGVYSGRTDVEIPLSVSSGEILIFAVRGHSFKLINK